MAPSPASWMLKDTDTSGGGTVSTDSFSLSVWLIAYLPFGPWGVVLSVFGGSSVYHCCIFLLPFFSSFFSPSLQPPLTPCAASPSIPAGYRLPLPFSQAVFYQPLASLPQWCWEMTLESEFQCRTLWWWHWGQDVPISSFLKLPSKKTQLPWRDFY